MMLDFVPQQVKNKLALAFLFMAQAAVANPTDALVSRPNASKVVPAATDVAELLDPERAFRPQFRQRDANTAEIKFEVVPGYYLYRDRIRVEGQLVEPSTGTRNTKPTSGLEAAATPLVLSMPPGRFVEDPTFGRVEIYDQNVVFLVDLAALEKRSSLDTSVGKRGAVAKRPTKFLVTSQGCAAAGVCFPPQQHKFAVPASVSSSREPRTMDSGWALPIGEATSLGFGRPKSASTREIIPK